MCCCRHNFRVGVSECVFVTIFRPKIEDNFEDIIIIRDESVYFGNTHQVYRLCIPSFKATSFDDSQYLHAYVAAVVCCLEKSGPKWSVLSFWLCGGDEKLQRCLCTRCKLSVIVCCCVSAAAAIIARACSIIISRSLAAPIESFVNSRLFRCCYVWWRRPLFEKKHSTLHIFQKVLFV